MAMKCTSLRGRFQTMYVYKTRQVGGPKMCTFCQRSYHRKYQRRGFNIGGQKSQILVNVVYERPLSLHSLQNNDTQYVSSTHKTLGILILSLLLSGNLRRFFLVFNSSKNPKYFPHFLPQCLKSGRIKKSKSSLYH